MLIEAFRRLAPAGVELVIAGDVLYDGAYARELMSSAGGGVRFVGAVLGAPFRALVQHADRDCEERKAMDEVRGPVDGVHGPDEGRRVRQRRVWMFFAEHRVLWKPLGEMRADHGLDALVDVGHRVTRESAFGSGGLVADGPRARQRRDHLAAGGLRQLEGELLDLVELARLGGFAGVWNTPTVIDSGSVNPTIQEAQ